MKVALFSGSLFPATRAHAWVARKLSTLYPRVIVAPRGWRHPGEFDAIPSECRAEMCRLAFAGIDGIELDLSDIDGEFTHVAERHDRLRADGIDPIHVVRSGLVENGQYSASDIHTWWKDGTRLWETAQFAVVTRLDAPFDPNDLPPRFVGPMLECPIRASGRSVREAYADGNVAAAVRQLQPQVAAYIAANSLFRQIEPSI